MKFPYAATFDVAKIICAYLDGELFWPETWQELKHVTDSLNNNQFGNLFMGFYDDRRSEETFVKLEVKFLFFN